MIVPVGTYSQVLKKIVKRSGRIETTDIIPVVFVPMTGEGVKEKNDGVMGRWGEEECSGVKPKLYTLLVWGRLVFYEAEELRSIFSTRRFRFSNSTSSAVKRLSSSEYENFIIDLSSS